jgi:hypothetical protein
VRMLSESSSKPGIFTEEVPLRHLQPGGASLVLWIVGGLLD